MKTPGERELRDLVLRQVGAIWPVSDDEASAVELAIPVALEACEESFSRTRNKYYRDESGETTLEPLHGCQWTHFLYRLSQVIWKTGRGGGMPDKVYSLLRTLSSADLFYQVDLPDVFTFDHPLGTVMGRAQYSSYLSFSQGVTVGNNHGFYPEFGSSVFLMSDCKVLGGCRIGDYVIVSAGTYVKDQDIPSGSIVFGSSPNLVIKHRPDYVKEYAEGVFYYE